MYILSAERERDTAQMASRRKQFKPKSFGTDEELETTVAIVDNQQIETTERIENVNIQGQIDSSDVNNNEKKRKRDVDLEDRVENKQARRDQDVSGSTAETINSGGETSSVIDDADLDDDEYDEDEEDDGYDENGNGFEDDEYHSMYEAANSSMVANGGLMLMFKCKVCGKAFKHRRSLSRHIKLHSGEKNFKCPYCTTAFARSDHLKAHIRTHNNTKPYRCSICHCGYSTQAALKVRLSPFIQVTQLGIFIYQGSQCPSSYQVKVSL